MRELVDISGTLAESTFTPIPESVSELSKIATIKTLVAVKSPIFEASNSSFIIYRPELASKGNKALSEALRIDLPDFLIVGANEVDIDALQNWNNAKSIDQNTKPKNLCVIRRGTSLAAIDLKAADELDIKVENTPGVNSIYVADFVNQLLYQKSNIDKNQIIGLIGFGDINFIIAEKALAKGHSVIAYSPSLAFEKKTGQKISRLKNLDQNKIRIADSIAEIFAKSDYIIISAGIDKSKKDTGIIDSEDLLAIDENHKKNIICISEPEVFSPSAIEILAKKANQKYLTAHFDNSLKSMQELEKKLLDCGYQKNGISFSSKAMSDPNCQQDMDSAVLALLVKHALKYKLPEILTTITENLPQNPQSKTVKIFGAGISGMIGALYLHEKGYDVQIFDKAPNPKNSQDWKQQGASRRVDARHLSVSETVTHADLSRIEKWSFDKFTDPNYFEEKFTKEFAHIGKNPALIAIFKKSVAELNSLSLNNPEFGWEYIKSKYPQIFDQSTFGNGKILRVFYNDHELNQALNFQNLIHKENEVRKIHGEELTNIHPEIFENPVKEKIISGAVEVPGLGLRIVNFCQAIENWLYDKSGIEIKWDHNANPADSDFELTDKVTNIIATSTSPIIEKQKEVNGVYGLFVSITNSFNLKDPIKIHAPDPIGVVNITPSENKSELYISGGFQYFGHKEATEAELEFLFTDLEKIIKELFGKDCIFLSKQYCARPMTSHGFFQFATHEDNIVLGGTNAGGAVLSPLTAALALLQTCLYQKELEENLALKAEEFLEFVKFSLNSLARSS